MGKGRFQDLKNGLINSPALFALAKAEKGVGEKIQGILKKGELSLEDSEYIYEFIQDYGGIEDSTLLSNLFIDDALSCLDYISDHYQGELQFHGLKELCSLILSRNK